MKITMALLLKRNACSEQRQEFAKRFPYGVEVTEAAALAVADVFDWKWAADSLLPTRELRFMWRGAEREAFSRRIAAVAAAWDEYPYRFWDEDLQKGERDAAIEAVWRVYEQEIAVAFVQAWLTAYPQEG